jgi:hypothetical protein
MAAFYTLLYDCCMPGFLMHQRVGLATSYCAAVVASLGVNEHDTHVEDHVCTIQGGTGKERQRLRMTT